MNLDILERITERFIEGEIVYIPALDCKGKIVSGDTVRLYFSARWPKPSTVHLRQVIHLNKLYGSRITWVRPPLDIVKTCYFTPFWMTFHPYCLELLSVEESDT